MITLAKDNLIAVACIELAKDYLNAEIDRLVAKGRIPEKNIEAAKNMSAKVIEWLENQEDDVIIAQSMCPFAKVGEKMVAYYNCYNLNQG